MGRAQTGKRLQAVYFCRPALTIICAEGSHTARTCHGRCTSHSISLGRIGCAGKRLTTWSRRTNWWAICGDEQQLFPLSSLRSYYQFGAYGRIAESAALPTEEPVGHNRISLLSSSSPILWTQAPNHPLGFFHSEACPGPIGAQTLVRWFPDVLLRRNSGIAWTGSL